MEANQADLIGQPGVSIIRAAPHTRDLSASRDRATPDFDVFHPGITPLAPGLGPARVDHWVSIEPVAIAVSRLRQSPGIASLNAMYQNSNNTPSPHCCQQLVTSRRIVVGVQLLTLFTTHPAAGGRT